MRNETENDRREDILQWIQPHMENSLGVYDLESYKANGAHRRLL